MPKHWSKTPNNSFSTLIYNNVYGLIIGPVSWPNNAYLSVLVSGPFCPNTEYVSIIGPFDLIMSTERPQNDR